jgi:peptidoglycan/LPS O-acetylase OafA/YrhL
MKATYIPELDFLRAVAVVSVIVYHYFPSQLPSGFLGVDVFFVLSGFLLPYSVSNKDPSIFATFFSKFVYRRIKRLFPTLLLYSIIFVVVVFFFNPDPSFDVRSGIFSLFGLSNFYLIKRSTDYFSPSGVFNPFLHTWSLSVEWQSYVVFAFVSGICGSIHRSFNGTCIRILFLIFALLVVFSYIGFAQSFYENTNYAYFSILTRFWEIAFGVLVGFVVLYPDLFRTNYLQCSLNGLCSSYVALLLIICLIFLFQVDSHHVYLHLFAVILSAMILVIFYARRDYPGLRVLTFKPVLYIGIISYSLYLWHWGLFSLMNLTIGFPSATIGRLLLLSLLFAISSISYNYVESRYRYKDFPALSAMVYFLIVVIFSFISAYSPNRLSSFLYLGSRSVNSDNNSNDSYRGFRSSDASFLDAQNDKFNECNLTPQYLGKVSTQVNTRRTEFLRYCMGPISSSPKIILIGDSFTGQFLNTISLFARDNKYKLNSVHGFNCPFPLDFRMINNSYQDKCRDYDIGLLRDALLSSLSSGDVVILRVYFTKDSYLDYKGFDSRSSHDIQKMSSSYDSELLRLSTDLSKIGARLVVLGDNPSLTLRELKGTNPQWYHSIDFIRRSSERSLEYFFTNYSPQSILSFELDSHLAKLSLSSGFRYFSFYPFLCPKRYSCRYGDAGGSYYGDSVHLTPYFESVVALRLREFLNELNTSSVLQPTGGGHTW